MSCSKITLVASSIRPYLWKAFMEFLKPNTIDYEVIFVGDVKNPIELPKMRFIQTKVKPAQCYEVGFRAATSELISWTADEAIYHDNALDKMYEFYKSFNSKKLVTGFTIYENNGICLSKTSDTHYLDKPDSPRMMCLGVIDREYFRSLGGYDKYFITGQAENDVCMRVLEDGGKCIICDKAMATINHNHDDSSKFRKWYKESRQRLNDAWFIDGVWTSTRVRPFTPFDDENIITISQEPKGEW